MARLRFLRALLFTGFALVVCVISRSALASEAPFCDDRGATALAPPPALDASDQAVARVRACSSGGDESGYFAILARARSHAARSLQAADAAAPAPLLEVAGGLRGELCDSRCDSAPHAAVRSRIDRPPRS
jgi:hypothetical protein